jgi:competence transcription factor ComK
MVVVGITKIKDKTYNQSTQYKYLNLNTIELQILINSFIKVSLSVQSSL